MEEEKLIMVYDTETTGIWHFKDPEDPYGPRPAWNSDIQPNLCQLGYKVYDRNQNVIFEVGHLVNTTKFPSWRGIEPKAEEIHGISEELLRKWGTDPDEVMQQFNHWASRCNLFIAHNDNFDAQVMKCFAYRAGWHPDVFREEQGSKKFCTMMFTTSICKIPSPNGRGHKWPKLNEAYPFFFNGQQFENAHNALADVNPTAKIFWHLVNQRMIEI